MTWLSGAPAVERRLNARNVLRAFKALLPHDEPKDSQPELVPANLR